MATVHFATTPANSALAPLMNAIDAGATGGTIKVYTGTMPATPATAITSQTLLGTLTFAKPCGAISDKQFTAYPITQDASADANGTATWARISNGNGNVVMDIDVTVIGGGGVLQLNTVNIVAGGPILVSSFVMYLP